MASGGLETHNTLPQEQNVRDIVLESGFAPDAHPDMIQSVTDVGTPHHPNAYLVSTSPGIDLVVKVNGPPDPDEESWPGEAYAAMLQARSEGTTEWQHLGLQGFDLGGLLVDRKRVIATPDSVQYLIDAFTSHDKYNQIITDLGRTPGVDTFRQVPAASGEFTAESSAEAASRLEVLVADQDYVFVKHDRASGRGGAHIHAWWSTPPSIARRIQQRAANAVASGDRESQVAVADGVDRLAQLSGRMIRPVAEFVDESWDTETPEARQSRLNGIVGGFAESLGTTLSPAEDACVALVELGLISPLPIVEDGVLKSIGWPKDGSGRTDQNSPELAQARRELAAVAGAYAANIADMLGRASSLQGTEAEMDPRRREFIDRLVSSQAAVEHAA